MVNVLFVCLGNICRSPMAEAIFRKKIAEHQLSDRIDVDSAGLGHWHVGRPPHEGTQQQLKNKGITYEGMTARQLSKSDLSRFDYIIAMDTDNIAGIQKMIGQESGTDTKISRLLDYVPDSEKVDIPDPYFTGNFDETYALVEVGCTQLLQYIQERENLL